MTYNGFITCTFITVFLSTDNILKIPLKYPYDLNIDILLPCIKENTKHCNNLERVILVGACGTNWNFDVIPNSKNKKCLTVLCDQRGDDMITLTDEQILSFQALFIDLAIPIEISLNNLNFTKTSIDVIQIKKILKERLSWYLKYYYQTRLPTFIFNFSTPGNLVHPTTLKYPERFDRGCIVKVLNSLLDDIVHDLPNVYVIDYDSMLNLIGKANAFQVGNTLFRPLIFCSMLEKASPLRDITRFDIEHVQNISSVHYSRSVYFDITYKYINFLYKIINSTNRIDLVIIDIDYILTPTTPEQHHEQHASCLYLGTILKDVLNQLFFRKIHLSICSKNDINYIKSNWSSIIGVSQNCFHSINISNTINYSETISHTIKELNLHPDDVLFVSNNKQVLENVKENIPNINTLGGLQGDYLAYKLSESIELRRIYNENYSFLNNKKNILNFLKDIEIIKYEFSENDINVDYIIEFTNNTDIFNTNTTKRNIKDIKDFIKDQNNKIFYFKHREKCSVYDIKCVYYVRGNCIEQIILHHDIFGMYIECNTLYNIITDLYTKYDSVTALYHPTRLNIMCKEFLHKHNFSPVEQAEYFHITGIDNDKLQQQGSITTRSFYRYRDKSVNTVTLLHNKNAFKPIELPIKIIKQ